VSATGDFQEGGTIIRSMSDTENPDGSRNYVGGMDNSLAFSDDGTLAGTGRNLDIIAVSNGTDRVADVDSVRHAINDAREEALIRQQGREAAAEID
jgi:hypothetical protein